MWRRCLSGHTLVEIGSVTAVMLAVIAVALPLQRRAYAAADEGRVRAELVSVRDDAHAYLLSRGASGYHEVEADALMAAVQKGSTRRIIIGGETPAVGEIVVRVAAGGELIVGGRGWGEGCVWLRHNAGRRGSTDWAKTACL